MFFCKYNDPFYIKHAKLRIVLQLVSSTTVIQVLSELKEYASEVDLDFARQSIQAISHCAINYDSAANAAVDILMEIIDSHVNYIVQDAIIVMKDIIRRYPDRFEYTIPTLCNALSVLDHSEAKSALIWIVGEYAERIEDAPELLNAFCELFQEEADLVQLQLLTTAVKVFSKHKDTRSQHVVQRLLRKASTSESPDVRDRAFIYWRLLSSNVGDVNSVIS